MKSTLLLILFTFLSINVFGADVEVPVMVGDSVTLHTEIKIQIEDVINWHFKQNHISMIDEGSIEITASDVEFRGRLQLDSQTGDLKIRNIKTTDSGDYKLKITKIGGSSEKTFSVRVVPPGAVKSVSVMEGDSVTLLTGLTDIQKYDVIQWKFGVWSLDNYTQIAEISSKSGMPITSFSPDGRFRGRLQLDNHNGSLNITNIKSTHSGLYEADISDSGYTIHKTFNVTVSDVVVSLSVMVGDSVTLHTDFAIIQNKHLVSWFDDQNNAISTTRDHTIRNIRRDQSGIYKVNIINSSSMVLQRKFCINISGVFSSEKDGVKTVSVMNGESVTLQTNVTDIQNGIPIEWMFGPQNISIAKTDGKSNKTSYNNNDVRFKNKLYLDIQTGALSIKNSNKEHSGLYQLKIISNTYTIQKSFSVTVSDVSGSGASIGILVGVGGVGGVLLVAAVCYCFRKQILSAVDDYCPCCKKSEQVSDRGVGYKAETQTLNGTQDSNDPAN